MKSLVFCEYITNIPKRQVICFGLGAVFWYLRSNTQGTVIYVNAGTAFTCKVECSPSRTDSLGQQNMPLKRYISKVQFLCQQFSPSVLSTELLFYPLFPTR